MQKRKTSFFRKITTNQQAKEIYVAKGDKITQEERIKNEDKIIKYPNFIVPAKGKFKTYWD